MSSSKPAAAGQGKRWGKGCKAEQLCEQLFRQYSVDPNTGVNPSNYSAAQVQDHPAHKSTFHQYTRDVFRNHLKKIATQVL